MKSINLTNTVVFFISVLILACLFSLTDIKFSLRSSNITEDNDEETNGLEEHEGLSLKMKKEYMESFYYPKTTEEVAAERSEYLKENGTFNSINNGYENDNPMPWTCVGPFGIITGVQPPSYNTGRVISFAMYSDNVNNLFAGGASGGLWKSTNAGASWYCLLDTLSCPSVSSIATSYLAIDNTVWISTGAFIEGAGPQISRVYKSTTGGATWQHITTIPEGISWISKIEVNVFNKNLVYIATSQGLYRTTNGGSNFTRVFTGKITDVIMYTNLLAPDESNVVAALVEAGAFSGIIRSTSGGAGFYTVPLPPLSNNGLINRITLTRDPATSKTYALVGRNNGKFFGIWYSGDKGASWTQKTFPTADSGDQSNYNQGIGVSPNSRVYVGYSSKKIYYSSNNGSTWSSGNDVHEDVHKIFVFNNSLVYNISDGGVFKSADQGVFWSPAGNNYLPLTQSYTLKVDESYPDAVWSGLQDDGMVQGFDGFFRWIPLSCCDGGDYNRFINYQYMNVTGLDTASPTRYQRKLTTSPPSASWEGFSTGLPNGWPMTQAGPNEIKYWGFNLYTSMNQYVYKTSSPGVSLPWMQIGSRPHPTADWYVGKFLPMYNCVLAGFDVGVNPVIRRYNNSTGNWETPDTSGIPQYTRVTDFSEGNTAERVFMTVSGTVRGRVFKSTNTGLNWINITGDLPSLVNARCILPDHNTNDNIIYIGSDFGVYYTTNGGTNWHKYSSGLPSVCFVNDLGFSGSHNLIYAATYGRGVWRTDAIIGIHNISEIAENFSLSQNYPNPFNPVTNIKFSIPKKSLVKLVIYDIQGREVETLVNKNLERGTYNADWNGSKYSSGVYFYKLITDGFSGTKKMILIK